MRDFRKEKELGLMGVELDEALRALAEKIRPIGETEAIRLEEARDRILSEEITSPIDLPPFDRSPLDGYALMSSDTDGVDAAPVTLSVIDTLHAGSASALTVTSGTAVRLMTGAPIPNGADCVVPFERVEEGADRITLRTSLKKNANVCFRGEDVERGRTVASAGTKLDWRSVGVLAATGRSSVRVYRRPKIAVFSTGDELTSRDTAPDELARSAGKIYESNSLTLTFALAELGFEAANLGIQPDDPEKVAALVSEPLADCDLIVTSGGVSTGDRDIIHDVLDRLEAETVFRWVKVRPGSPVMVNRVGTGKKTVLASLSGNPFAAVVNFHVFVRAILALLTRDPSLTPRRETAVMADDYPKASPVRRLLRGNMLGGRVSIPTGHSPGMIGNVANSNVLIDVPAGTPSLRAGDEVQVLRIHNVR